MIDLDTDTEHSSRNGVVGNRHLVAVQTFDIARLTTHAVALVPGTFVAVSGQGPKSDSNGSGKTSFLAAVSLLLGEAQWRLEANGSQYAASLLFKPESAGLDPQHRYARADRGYIVGVFAEPDSPQTTALTVWLRVASGPPYVKVRWTYGLHIAIADTDLERDAIADSLWEALPRTQELGPRRFAGELYGQAPRCMAYLDTPMRPSAPSLLSQQMTEMTPARIGDALIELTGRQGLLETEKEQRSKLAEQQDRLATTIAEDSQARTNEQTDLDAVHHRNQARQHLADGEHMWRLHFASGYLDVSATDRSLAEIIGELEQQVSDLKLELEGKRTAVQELRAQTNLHEEEDVAKTHHREAKEKYETANVQRGITNSKLGELKQKRVELLPLRDAWTGITAVDAEAEVHAAKELFEEARQYRLDAERSHTKADRALTDARSGSGGPAGPALELLRANNIPAALLLDEITLETAVRPHWEPRLWPYRNTIVVSPGKDEDDALILLAGSPGAEVLTADGPLNRQPAELPDGVSATVPVAGFIRTLERRTEFRPDPDRAVDAELGVSVQGGFTDEIAGRAARIASAEIELFSATQQLTTRKDAEEYARLSLEAAQDTLAAAQAVQELEQLETQEAELTEQISDLDTQLATLNTAVEDTQNVWVNARAASQGHEQQIELAVGAVRLCDGEVSSRQGKLQQRKQDRDKLNLDYWLAGWADTSEAAQNLLDAQSEQIRTLRPRSLRHRAAEKLKDALDAYTNAATEVPPELAEARQRRQRLADGDAGVAGKDSDFTSIARPLRDLLDTRADSDQILESRISRSQQQRATRIEAMQTEIGDLDAEMGRLQDVISSRVETSLNKISIALNRLNRARGGFGAELHITETRPATPTMPWTWEVSPRWRRSPSGSMVSYREVANGAQVKVFAIQLVLAALLAADGAEGRMLVLDELGNSLGDVNRKDVLRDLNEVAAQQRVTILGTCQDSVIGDAAGVCGEILWFCHQSPTEAYNRPTRAWGYDANGQRIELVREWLTAGRSLV
ncbi:hypothetical protein BJY24_001046 [Nocardia transvalensis]|uniref:Uncharacterized protein n=1 Tax=Nocardia transvalensis TaxID=37333 RepID=A0A7W9PAL7_9NOCA|nr:hypothetical protein [Nocardia transvalensis]MBB5912179.1 hypothetical protein [Nocardia transvalensis]